ncbi:MAG: DUF6311 domain-containing protein [Pseudomonadota bacterium]
MKMYASKQTEKIFPLLLGALAFFIIIGPRALHPKNIAWLGEGDQPTYYLGWLFFRNSDWSFPIGLNPAYGLELGSAILFSDSNPLFAFLFKPFTTFLPEPFQYFGIWLLVCFVLQAWFAWKLTGLLSDRTAIRTLGTGLFVFAPPMLLRMGGHLSLAGHFLILAALYLSFHPAPGRRRGAWVLLLALAALVHAYLLAMVALLWLADLAGKTMSRTLPMRSGVLELALVLSVTAIACWQAGYFSVGPGTSADGFGLYRMNLLSLFDSSGWSHVLKDIPEGDAQAGSNFLGLGVIFLAVCTLPAAIGGATGFGRAVRRFPVLVLVLAGLAVFAVSNRVGLGSLVVEYPLPELVLEMANVFRASERMFWPAFYAIVFIIIFLIVRGYNHRTALYLLGLALVIQVLDTSASWRGIHKNLMTKPASTWASPLVSPFWAHAASRYKKVRWIKPMSNSPKWLPLAAYAGTHGLATDAVYLARIGTSALEQAQRKAADAIRTGKFEADALYVFDDVVFRNAASGVDFDTDVLARVDGFNVLAPGWKKCAGCPPIAGEVNSTDLIPPFNIGERLLTSRTGAGVAYLESGWSSPEPWGTWSDGDTAKIILPVSGKIRSLLMEANVLVTPVHPKQEIVVTINDVLVFTASLTKPSGNLIDIAIPEKIQENIANLGVMHVQIQFPNAVNPKKIGFKEGDRKLALGLQAITLR